MAGYDMSSVLEQSNEQLIRNLNGQVYTQPQLSPEMMATPLYQSAMAGQGPSDPFALQNLAAQGRASLAYSNAMAQQAEQESMHALIRGSLLALPPVIGVPLSFAYDPLTKALGLRDPTELYRQSDYIKSNMAASMANAMVGQMGGAFLGGNMSIDQANSLADNMYGFMRQRGFQGLELGRIMPMLGESGLMSTQGGFQNAEEALTQFENRLGGFLDKIATTVRNTSADIETATVMAINESMLSGSRNAVAGGSYTGAAQSMSGLTGMNMADSEAAMRRSLGSWGNTLYDRTNMAETLAVNVGGAITASRQGGVFDAAWIGVDAGQVGMELGAWGNQYWAGQGKNLGRLWSSGSMPGSEAWNSIVAGQGIPDSVGSYGSIGNLNAQLEAQYYGMQVAAENPEQMMVAAMGMMISEMEKKGITTRPAQIMYLTQRGHTQASAARLLSTYDQQSTQEGRMGSLFEGYRVEQGTRAQMVRDDIAEIIRITPQLSNEDDPELNQYIAASGFAYGQNSDILGTYTADETITDQSNKIMEAGADRGTYNLSFVNMAASGVLHGSGYGADNNILLGAIEGSGNAAQYLSGMRINLGHGGALNLGLDVPNVLDAVKEMMRAEFVAENPLAIVPEFTNAQVNRWIAEKGGLENISIRGHSLGDYGRGLGGTLEASGMGAFTMIGGLLSQYVEDVATGSYDDLYNAERVLGARFSAGPHEAQLYAQMAERGMFSGVGGMEGLDAYRTATSNFDASRYLGTVTEGLQGYRESGAYGAQYRTFLNKLEDEGVNFRSAISGQDSGTATGQIAARDVIAQAGFGKSYGSLTDLERNFVEEVFHVNDRSGEWAGRHSDLIEDAQATAFAATEGVSFAGGRRASELMGNVSRAYGVGTDQIEAYAAWSAAVESGADEATVRHFRNQITDFQTAEEAYIVVANQLGRNAQGQILSGQAVSAITAGAGSVISEEQLNQVWAAFANDGKIDRSEISDAVMSALSGTDVEKMISGEMTVEDFFKRQGSDVPLWAQGEGIGARELTSIPEFQDGIKALVTPAGGIMPVVFGSEGMIAQYQQMLADSEAASQDTDQGDR